MLKIYLTFLLVLTLGINTLAQSKSDTLANDQIIIEVQKIFKNKKTSRYQHKTIIDEQKGIYNFDCSGLVNYVLNKTHPQILKSDPTLSLKKRPRAIDYLNALSSSKPNPHWKALNTPAELIPGDFIVWKKATPNQSISTGHLMIVKSKPIQSSVNKNEFKIIVFDSSLSGHKNDTRHNNETGIGEGEISIVTNDSHVPIGYKWKSDESKKTFSTLIKLGRLN